MAAALIHNPKILYLDEPTIGLDIVVKDKIRDAIKLMQKNFNTTVILTTHDIVDIEELCSHIIIIDEGRKIYDGSLGDIKEQYKCSDLTSIVKKIYTNGVDVNA